MCLQCSALCAMAVLPTIFVSWATKAGKARCGAAMQAAITPFTLTALPKRCTCKAAHRPGAPHGCNTDMAQTTSATFFLAFSLSTCLSSCDLPVHFPHSSGCTHRSLGTATECEARCNMIFSSTVLFMTCTQLYNAYKH